MAGQKPTVRPKLAGKLTASRRKRFVGREEEKNLFLLGLNAAEPPFAVLHIHGPGGVGKSTLVAELMHLAQEAGASAIRLDGREIEASPEGFLLALGLALELTPQITRREPSLRPGISRSLANTLPPPETRFSPQSGETKGASPPEASGRGGLNQGVSSAFGTEGASLRAVWEIDKPRKDVLSALETLAAQSRVVLFLDTYEALNPLDGWLREHFLPLLPENALVVLAGRNPPSEGWQGDPGWHDLLHSVSLRNLRPEESREYLRRRGVPEEQHRAVLEFTHGHPLALSLVAEVIEGGQSWNLQPHTPDIVRSLLGRFVQTLPSPEHRAALEAAALVRRLTEPLLAAALAIPDAYGYFQWLRGLSFMEYGAGGLFPHDLAREALDADLRWRNPDWYAELHRRLRGYYTRKLLESRGAEQQATLFDDVYLHRHNPMVKPFLEWAEHGSVFPERGGDGDQGAVLDMVRTHQGDTAAKVAAHWLARQPEGLTIYRGQGHGPVGFLLTLALHKASPQDLAADPVAQSAWAYAQRHAPVRPGEEVSLFRFWMAQDTHQAVSPVQSLVFINAAQHYISHPRLAWSFFCAANPEFWAPAFLYMGIHRATELDHAEGEHRAGVFAHDWRAQPVAAWLEMLGERELATDLDPKALEAARPAPLLVLSQPEFEEAVRAALRDFARPAALGQNPLLRSRLLAERAAGQPATAAHLQALLLEAAASLQTNPKDQKLFRVLHRTYLEPAATQEVAAELLDLPFSTYRRHLGAGVERVCTWLWELELYGSAQP